MEGDLLCLNEREMIDLAVGEDSTFSQPDVIDVDALENTEMPSHQQMEKEKKSAAVEIDEREERKKRRRIMRRMLKPEATPSFVALLTPHVEEEEEEAPKHIRIDVDDYLGLKKKEYVAPQEAMPSGMDSVVLPAEEGWFEGVVPLALPGEERFLPELQVLIRSNLELFSATEVDANTPQPGRRTKTVRGKVGVRCIHCSKAVGENPSLPWPSASISYPINIVGLYPVCTQKPQLHFEKCPYMPADIKEHLQRLLFDEEGIPRRQRKAAPGSTEKSMSTVLYYTISAKMIGMVDVPGGMRFGRDLALEPLPMETVRAQIEDTQEPYKRSGGNAQAKPAPVLSNEPRITADVESERVLAQAVAEKDDDKLLAKSDDKKLVTDFIFLCIKQMAICHAVKSDFATRGKKTRMMRIGFAGFCCRHCAHFNPNHEMIHNVDFSCRSFSSAADNLASAISNSFYIHVQKCPATPLEIRNALTAYRRIHSRQMDQLPYGSQRRMFQILWSRLRAADMSAEELDDKLKKMPPPPQPMMASLAASPAAQGVAAVGSLIVAQPDAVLSSPVDTDASLGRRGPMPVCNDEETMQVLKREEQSWDPTVNDNIVLPEDRNLITDFVFLIMRQLKAAHPSQIDFTRGKRTTVVDTSQPGLKCIHCVNQPQAHFFTVGRSFPSAPDNMASTLNSSMFQHLQKCLFTPEDVKRALANLKRIHSVQCSSLRFGSQRRFFNLVFQRLRNAPIDEADANVKAEEPETSWEEQGSSVEGADDVVLAQCGFVETANGCVECQFCRMVPFTLRARNSMMIGRPQREFVEGHQNLCKKDAFDLGSAVDALKAATDKYPALSGSAIFDSPAFGRVIREAAGHDVGKAITEGLVQAMMEMQEAKERENQNSPAGLSGLWSKFPSSVDNAQVARAFEAFAGTVPGLESDLVKEAHFLRFLRIISPSLVMIETTTETQG